MKKRWVRVSLGWPHDASVQKATGDNENADAVYRHSVTMVIIRDVLDIQSDIDYPVAIRYSVVIIRYFF